MGALAKARHDPNMSFGWPYTDSKWAKAASSHCNVRSERGRSEVKCSELLMFCIKLWREAPLITVKG